MSQATQVVPVLSAGLPGAKIRTGLRPSVRGKFLFVGEEKLYIRGATYGTFRPREDGTEFPERSMVERDFAEMAATGLNAVRTYTVPPRWLLDAAGRQGLFVMVGLPWEQHIAFLDDPRRAAEIEQRVRIGVRVCRGHPAVLCYVVGNEIPAPIVRWHGRRRVERYIQRLYRAAKAEDPGALVTYVNYPSTEYLQLPFLDFACFNVYLEAPDRLEAYLARLQNIAGNRPLVMAEAGLDSRRHGEKEQARTLEWQARTVFAAGCAGLFVFAWTDEWHRGGYDIEEWAFGLTDRNRRPKPALGAVRDAFANSPFPVDLTWPRISVVVCTHNGTRTIRDCFEGLTKIDYPNYEAIVVDDGSTNKAADTASSYGFRVIRTDNQGLGNARNVGLEAATGEIVAYIDDDAYPDPRWLTYLAATFQTTTHAGVGGPNIAPPGDGSIADCVANAPGGPVHVLLSDQEAEHIPGCNMAYRKACLEAIGGFDPQFRTAGDDVDICWQLHQRGWTLGFSPAAMVWHHRRNSVRAYWKQQKGYGRAEALLERKWPQKYNALGHLTWAGRLYGQGLGGALPWVRSRVYHGVWGSAPFQSLYEPGSGGLAWLHLMPECYLVIAVLGGISALAGLWRPMVFALPMLGAALGLLVISAVTSASRARFASDPQSGASRLKLVGLTAFLHLIQPLARLWGRLSHGLSPWRLERAGRFLWPRCRSFTLWSERWRAPHERLAAVESALRYRRIVTACGGDYDHWDLEVQGGILGGARTLMTVEEHGAGRQLARFRLWPKFSALAVSIELLMTFLAVWAGRDGAWRACSILAVAAALLAWRSLEECGAATGALLRALGELANEEK